MKLININKNWKLDAQRAVDTYRENGILNNLLNSLLIINPYPTNVLEYEGYRNWVNENIQAIKAGDLTRISDTSSNSILNSDEEEEDDAKPYATFRKGRTLSRPGGMERIQEDIEDTRNRCQQWIETLIRRYSEFHKLDEDTYVNIPEDMRMAFRAVGLQTREHVGGPGSGMEHVAAGVDADGIITENGKHIAWEDLEGETAVMEVAYHLDEILHALFTKTPQGIVEKMLNEIYGDMTATCGESNRDVAFRICKELDQGKFLKEQL